MDADYLKNNLGDALVDGLSAVMLNAPEDSVDYLGKWLLNYVDSLDEADRVAAAKEEDKARIDKFEAEEEKKAIGARNEEAAKKKVIADGKKAIATVLDKSKDLENVFQAFCDNAKQCVAASGVYIGMLDNDSQEPGTNVETDYIKYIAATEQDKFLLTKTLVREENGKGITLDALFVGDDPVDTTPDDEEVTDPVTGEVSMRKIEKPAPLLRHIFVPNMLVEPFVGKIKFHDKPKTGSYVAIKVVVESVMHNGYVLHDNKLLRRRL